MLCVPNIRGRGHYDRSKSMARNDVPWWLYTRVWFGGIKRGSFTNNKACIGPSLKIGSKYCVQGGRFVSWCAWKQITPRPRSVSYIPLVNQTHRFPPYLWLRMYAFGLGETLFHLQINCHVMCFCWRNLFNNKSWVQLLRWLSSSTTSMPSQSKNHSFVPFFFFFPPFLFLFLPCSFIFFLGPLPLLGSNTPSAIIVDVYYSTGILDANVHTWPLPPFSSSPSLSPMPITLSLSRAQTSIGVRVLIKSLDTCIIIPLDLRESIWTDLSNIVTTKRMILRIYLPKIWIFFDGLPYSSGTTSLGTRNNKMKKTAHDNKYMYTHTHSGYDTRNSTRKSLFSTRIQVHARVNRHK